jgi:hypothetical protein
MISHKTMSFMKSTALWVVSSERARLVGRTYRLSLHGRRTSEEISQPKQAAKLGFIVIAVRSSYFSYVRVLVRRGAEKSLAFPIFLFPAQRKEFFLDGLKKLEQRSHKCVELRGEYVE